MGGGGGGLIEGLKLMLKKCFEAFGEVINKMRKKRGFE